MDYYLLHTDITLHTDNRIRPVLADTESVGDGCCNNIPTIAIESFALLKTAIEMFQFMIRKLCYPLKLHIKEIPLMYSADVEMLVM